MVKMFLEIIILPPEAIALGLNRAGSNNAAFGYNSLGAAFSTGNNNSAFGTFSLQANTSGAAMLRSELMRFIIVLREL